MKVSGKFDYDLGGFASLDGHLDLGMLGKKFNAEGGVRGCLGFLEIEICRGINALISSKGIAACMVIDYWVDDWRPGFGYKWGDSLPTPYFSGCSLGPYRAKLGAHSSQAGEQTFELPAGLPGAAVAVTGTDHAPKVTLIGPKGEKLTMPDANTLVEDAKFFALRVPQSKLTNIAINQPSAGTWKVIVEDGSTIESLKVANGSPRSRRSSATVVGSGRTARCATTSRPSPARRSRSSSAARAPPVRSASPSKRQGELNFTPARRRLRAARDRRAGRGRGRVRLRAARRHPLPRAEGVPARPVKGLNFSRGKVTWTQTAGATRYVVTAKTDDGRTLVRNVGGHSVEFGQDIHFRDVKVVAVSKAGVLGR